MENKEKKLEELEKIKEEVIRFYQKSREMLNKSPIDEELNSYEDIRYVRVAYRLLWVAILKVLDYAFLSTGKIGKEELPKNEDEYMDYINRNPFSEDAQLLKKLFETFYKGINIAGYSMGLKEGKEEIDSDFRLAEKFIYRLGIKIEK
ncbi:MAG: DUF5618 family protein [Candidatus Hydrothermales bacterium]